MTKDTFNPPPDRPLRRGVVRQEPTPVPTDRRPLANRLRAKQHTVRHRAEFEQVEQLVNRGTRDPNKRGGDPI
jgi:hypothetical protein